MNKLTRSDLWSLEEYAERRPEYRAEVIAHKKNRQVALGDHARLYFEDDITVRYQIQEMLRIEKVFEAAGIQEELDAYNPLIGDGSNWKATFMIEFDDPVERATRLAEMIGIEDLVWVQVEGGDKVYAIADEDLDRENETKTSAIHFLRFEISPLMVASLKKGTSFQIGVDHPNYPVAGFVPEQNIRQSLVHDLADIN
ncbi:MAG: DUF3501 domain-containing protein [Gammaproteobacteria bacterium]|nr:MAG: DUF3501 domain-containing protein [Gammaproteobacteria bacterium]RLA52847.1 MAG: DUF3501 domain-containing protein [Gammaproteobacteria bacterium]